MEPTLGLVEGETDQTSFWRPPRWWGVPEWCATTRVSQRCENACPQPIQLSLALIDGEDHQNPFSKPPRQWGEPEWST